MRSLMKTNLATIILAFVLAQAGNPEVVGCAEDNTLNRQDYEELYDGYIKDLANSGKTSDIKSLTLLYDDFLWMVQGSGIYHAKEIEEMRSAFEALANFYLEEAEELDRENLKKKQEEMDQADARDYFTRKLIEGSLDKKFVDELMEQFDFIGISKEATYDRWFKKKEKRRRKNMVEDAKAYFTKQLTELQGQKLWDTVEDLTWEFEENALTVSKEAIYQKWWNDKHMQEAYERTHLSKMLPWKRKAAIDSQILQEIEHANLGKPVGNDFFEKMSPSDKIINRKIRGESSKNSSGRWAFIFTNPTPEGMGTFSTTKIPKVEKDYDMSDLYRFSEYMKIVKPTRWVYLEKGGMLKYTNFNEKYGRSRDDIDAVFKEALEGMKASEEPVPKAGIELIEQISQRMTDLKSIEYCNFPDASIPEPSSLIDLVEKIVGWLSDPNEHVLVNCFAGCGRSGTVCALLQLALGEDTYYEQITKVNTHYVEPWGRCGPERVSFLSCYRVVCKITQKYGGTKKQNFKLQKLLMQSIYDILLLAADSADDIESVLDRWEDNQERELIKGINGFVRALAKHGLSRPETKWRKRNDDSENETESDEDILRKPEDINFDAIEESTQSLLTMWCGLTKEVDVRGLDKLWEILSDEAYFTNQIADFIGSSKVDITTETATKIIADKVECMIENKMPALSKEEYWKIHIKYGFDKNEFIQHIAKMNELCEPSSKPISIIQRLDAATKKN